jgi:hypothetical protein
MTEVKAMNVFWVLLLILMALYYAIKAFFDLDGEAKLSLCLFVFVLYVIAKIF